MINWKTLSTAARVAAVKKGKPSYQGAPCKHGHSGIRYTANKMCIECSGELRLEQTERLRAARAAAGKPIRAYKKRTGK